MYRGKESSAGKEGEVVVLYIDHLKRIAAVAEYVYMPGFSHVDSPLVRGMRQVLVMLLKNPSGPLVLYPSLGIKIACLGYLLLVNLALGAALVRGGAGRQDRTQQPKEDNLFHAVKLTLVLLFGPIN